MSHTTKSTVQGHLHSKKHQAAVETMKKREKARVECCLEAQAEALPHKAAMRQPSLQFVMASCNDKNKAADDTVFAFTGAGIPLDKLDHPLMRAWLQKYTTIAGCLPQDSSHFPKVNGQCVLDGHQGAIRKKIADRDTTLLFDEWTDERGVPVLAIIAHVGGRLKLCIDVAFLKGKGPQRGVEHKEIAGALLSSLATAQIHPDCINFVISDEGSTVVVAAKEFNLYRSTEFRNINNGDELLAWWESRSDSPFKEAVLFLITIPTSSGAVERFFSQSGNVSKKQHKLLNQMRRLAFMARFNLDVEGRLV